MSEQEKKLEACGDGLLLACARLYLKDRHSHLPYQIYTRLVATIIRNTTLETIAEGEGIRGKGEGKHTGADALEMLIARFYYRAGFESVKEWLFSLFDKYLDIEEEARKILAPTPEDKFVKQVRGAVKMVVSQRGPITANNVEKMSALVAAHLQQNGNGHH
jgi:dsRNA-specific ribonuclease